MSSTGSWQSLIYFPQPLLQQCSAFVLAGSAAICREVFIGLISLHCLLPTTTGPTCSPLAWCSSAWLSPSPTHQLSTRPHFLVIHAT